MSHIIYSGVTKNNYLIDDMINVNFDRIFKNENDEKYFARLSMYRKDGQPENEEGHPAIVLFSSEDEFNPLWAEPLDEDWNKYLDGYGVETEEFIALLPEFFKKAISNVAA
jgi:hypothetical protein